ncbi:hypothetical protein SAMN05443665_100153 [Actinomadura meyerae]|uniref:Uncharacterized protein n=1 Tax=Actinomadura meyerae TaxID=240840 RepID=A0A239BVF1_9ACTN|nr:hypothetical protein [Actinomadura meyerae]SNS11411.1 hypothetical protein SAMN05443665_100153 [Actinomadura meyerae]
MAAAAQAPAAPAPALTDEEAAREAEAAAVAAALPPLTDDQCARVAALLASVRGGEGR